MKWYAWGEYAIVNFKYDMKEYERVIRMNGYSISKSKVNGGWIYEAWKLPSTPLARFSSADEAKKYVEGLQENAAVKKTKTA